MDNKNIVITIDKGKFSNWFFTSILALAVVLFVSLIIRGIVVSKDDLNNADGIDTSLITEYYDSYLDVVYPAPGGTWGLGEDATIAEALEKVTDASKGSDNYFDILNDVLTEEVVSTVWYESDAWRQYMSFAFKPNTTLEDDEFIEFSCESFKKDMDDSKAEQHIVVDYKYDLYSVEQDSNNGVLMKMKVTNTYIDEKTQEPYDVDIYFIRYTNSLGANIMDITYGSINEDDTVIDYMKFFMNNMIPNYSVQAQG